MAQLQVFVSHSSEDKAACDTFVTALRRAGADVWYDEHNLGAGQILQEIQREVQARPIFIVLLSKAAFASSWVLRETTWAFNLYYREPNRLILPVTVGFIEAHDFNNTWLFLEDFKRVEAPGLKPYPLAEATERTLRLLELTPAGLRPAPATLPQPSESLDDLLAKGKALPAQQKYAEAIPFFERATLLDQHNFDAWATLGRLYGEVARLHDSLHASDRALALDEKQAWVWSIKGRALHHLRRYDEALTAYDRALVIYHDGADPWIDKRLTLRTLKGLALRFLERDDKARALALDPDYALTWYCIGDTLAALQRYEEAVAAYDKAITLDPDFAIAWYNKGIALRALDRTAEADALLLARGRQLSLQALPGGEPTVRESAVRALAELAQLREEASVPHFTGVPLLTREALLAAAQARSALESLGIVAPYLELLDPD